MSKSRSSNKESRTQSNQRYPSGHFDKEGLSQGKQDGAVRKSYDAYNTDVKDHEKGLKDASQS